MKKKKMRSTGGIPILSPKPHQIDLNIHIDIVSAEPDKFKGTFNFTGSKADLPTGYTSRTYELPVHAPIKTAILNIPGTAPAPPPVVQCNHDVIIHHKDGVSRCRECGIPTVIPIYDASTRKPHFTTKPHGFPTTTTPHGFLIGKTIIDNEDEDDILLDNTGNEDVRFEVVKLLKQHNTNVTVTPVWYGAPMEFSNYKQILDQDWNALS